jgi:hypothetical protein
MLVIGTFAGVHPASALALTILLAFGGAHMQHSDRLAEQRGIRSSSYSYAA